MDRYKVPIAQIGKFNFASEFYGYFELFSAAINNAISPMFMQSMNEGKYEESRKLFKQCLCYFVLAVSLFIIWSREVFFVMVRNEELSSMYYLASILIAGFIHRPVYLAISSALFYYEKTSSLLLITFSSSVIAFSLYLIFIPLYGIWAAAIITYLTLTLIAYLGYILPNIGCLFALPYKTWKVFLFLNIIVFLSLLLVDMSIGFKVPITLLLLGGIFLYYNKI